MASGADRHRIVQIGETLSAGSIHVTPLFPRRDPVADYLGLDEAVGRGLRVREVDDAGIVSSVVVENPVRRMVLLHEGEVLLGAKQDRVVDASVLLEPESVCHVAVSCTESGRWSAVSETFRPAPEAAHPELRRRKAEMLAAHPGAGSAQGEVWAAVAAKSERMGVASPTSALSDAFAAHRGAIDGVAARLPLQPGQCGVVLSLSGRPACLDLVSRPEVFARLYPKLLAGYLLDGLEHPVATDRDDDAVVRFVDAALGAPRLPGGAAGAAHAVRVGGPALIGAGLEREGELIQLGVHAV